MKSFITLLLLVVFFETKSQSVRYKIPYDYIEVYKYYPSNLDNKVIMLLKAGKTISVNRYIKTLDTNPSFDSNDDYSCWEVTYKGRHGFVFFNVLDMNEKLAQLKERSNLKPNLTYNDEDSNNNQFEELQNLKRKHKKHQKDLDNSNNGEGVNKPINSTGAEDLNNNPVIKSVNAANAKLAKEQLYKPENTDLVRGRRLNIDKADLDKYFPNGVDLALTDQQIKEEIEQKKHLEIIKVILVLAFIIIIIGFLLYKYSNKPKERPLL